MRTITVMNTSSKFSNLFVRARKDGPVLFLNFSGIVLGSARAAAVAVRQNRIPRLSYT